MWALQIYLITPIFSMMGIKPQILDMRGMQIRIFLILSTMVEALMQNLHHVCHSIFAELNLLNHWHFLDLNWVFCWLSSYYFAIQKNSPTCQQKNHVKTPDKSFWDPWIRLNVMLMWSCIFQLSHPPNSWCHPLVINCSKSSILL